MAAALGPVLMGRRGGIRRFGELVRDFPQRGLLQKTFRLRPLRKQFLQVAPQITIAATGFTKKCRPVRLVYFQSLVVQTLDLMPPRRFQASPFGNSGDSKCMYLLRWDAAHYL